MRKLGIMLGCMAVMMLGLVPLGVPAADFMNVTVDLPVWNFQGTWEGYANVMTDDATLGDNGLLKDVGVTVVVPNGSEQVDSTTGMAYFKAAVSFDPPFGVAGKSFDLLAAVKTKAPTRVKQDAMVMWSGNGVMGCSMGATVSLGGDPANDPMLLHGCMHFTSDALARPGQAAIVTAPAMAIIDLRKTQ